MSPCSSTFSYHSNSTPTFSSSLQDSCRVQGGIIPSAVIRSPKAKSKIFVAPRLVFAYNDIIVSRTLFQQNTFSAEHLYFHTMQFLALLSDHYFCNPSTVFAFDNKIKIFTLLQGKNCMLIRSISSSCYRFEAICKVSVWRFKTTFLKFGISKINFWQQSTLVKGQISMIQA